MANSNRKITENAPEFCNKAPLFSASSFSSKNQLLACYWILVENELIQVAINEMGVFCCTRLKASSGVSRSRHNSSGDTYLQEGSCTKGGIIFRAFSLGTSIVGIAHEAAETPAEKT